MWMNNPEQSCLLSNYRIKFAFKMDYPQTLDYLMQKLPMFSRIGTAAFKKDLTNTRILCEFLGNPQQKIKTIHIAGTNGKGSVSHMLAAILQQAGYKTGLYTSPHLKDFRERIKLNGKLCEKSFVVDFTQRIQPVIEKIEPSFFEITVAMAFDYFASNAVDIAVIEVGLGGRFDSTNIIRPELSVITNIGWDHMNLLGNSLDKIAFEKAGIIKENIPVIVGEVLPETRPVFEQTATEKKAPLEFAQEQYYVSDWQYAHHHLQISVAALPGEERMEYQLDLPGIYQTRNLLTVLSAVHRLQAGGWKLQISDIRQGLGQVKKLTGLHGRWETISENPAIILDVAHNEDGMRQVAEQIELISYRELHIIIGMVKDKAISRILSLLPKTANYYFTRSQLPRALPETELAAIAGESGLRGKTFPDVNTALREAKSHAHKADVILICGSVFLIGEVDYHNE